jgi:hypothetical protein
MSAEWHAHAEKLIPPSLLYIISQLKSQLISNKYKSGFYLKFDLKKCEVNIFIGLYKLNLCKLDQGKEMEIMSTRWKQLINTNYKLKLNFTE